MRPPIVPSPEFDADYAYTLAFGAVNSTNRTAYETDTARFWYDEDTGKLHLTSLASTTPCTVDYMQHAAMTSLMRVTRPVSDILSMMSSMHVPAGNEGITARYTNVLLASLPANLSLYNTANFFVITIVISVVATIVKIG